MPKKSYFSEKQNKCIEFFDTNINEFLKEPMLINKYIVIYDESIKGSFDSFELALEYALSNFNKDEFIIQQVINNHEIISFIRAAV